VNSMGVWIDSDVGFDDIAAILVVARSGTIIDGLSLVFGNAPLDRVRRNAAGAAHAFDWQFPIYSGRSMPVLAALETAQNIHGETGMATLGAALPECPPAGDRDAFQALCTWLERNEVPRRVLALGPLTNIAAVALARPDLAGRITDLIWMGGGLTSGNHTASAEFNAYADPEALAIVLAHGLPLRMIDLDACRKVQATPEDVAALRRANGRNATLLADLFGAYVDIAISRGRSAMALYDPLAAVALVAPEVLTLRPVSIAVELCGGLTRGRTIVETRSDRASFNAAIVADVDVAAARVIILDALRYEADR
jgi:purine nucleosidase